MVHHTYWNDNIDNRELIMKIWNIYSLFRKVIIKLPKKKHTHTKNPTQIDFVSISSSIICSFCYSVFYIIRRSNEWMFLLFLLPSWAKENLIFSIFLLNFFCRDWTIPAIISEYKKQKPGLSGKELKRTIG